MKNNQIILSYSSIQTFHTCKRQYKYRYIDKLKCDKVLPNKYISFGQSIHSALAKYNILTHDKQTIEVLHKLLRENWIRAGYDSMEEEKEFGLRGLDVLSNYYANPLDQGKKNLLVEQMVYLNLEGGFTLCGKIDKTYLRNDGALETTDYKTGKRVDSIDTLQMIIYLMLTKDKLGYFPDSISYYNLNENKKITRDLNYSFIQESMNFLEDITGNLLGEKEYACNPSPYCPRACKYYSVCNEVNKV